MSQQNKAYLFALTAVLMWSTVATAFKWTLRTVDPYQMLFYACMTAALVLLLNVAVRGQLAELKSAFVRHFRITLLAGLLNPVVYYVVLFAAYDRLPAQIAQPINYTWAIVLTLLSMLILKQAVTRYDLLAALTCYCGVVIIATQGEFGDLADTSWFGIALAVLSTFIWAGYWIINMRDPRPPEVGLCLNFLVALPVTGLICYQVSDLQVPVEGLLGSVYIGLIEMALSFLAWAYALKLSINTSRVNNLIFLSPFISLVLIHHILEEPIYTTTYVGLVLIVGGLLFQQLHAKTA
jgi:drug/metabolite transporter (DMT)-like permease